MSPPNPENSKPPLDQTHVDPQTLDSTCIVNEGSILHGLPASPKTETSAQRLIGKGLGKYEITALLGQGGMGLVLKAYDALIDREVAIKLLSAEFSSDEITLKRFLAEARAAGRLSHPNVVQIYDVGQTGTDFYLVMEYASGGSVNDRIQQRGAASVPEATRILSDACRGLSAAHSAGLVHRDIKPANLLRSQDGLTKVTDFGIVKDILPSGSQITRAGVVVGTPYFMSPEQCEGRDVDCRSDLYSLGATYYSILTGLNPYARSSSMMQVMFAHCNSEPPDPREVNPQIPVKCAAIVAKAMAKSPADRYQSADEMLVDLQSVIDTYSGSGPVNLWDTTSTKNVPTLRRTNHAEKQTRRSFLIGGASLLGAAGVGAGLYWANSKSNAIARKDEENAIVPIADNNPITVGILHSLSGTMANSETSVVDATLFAFEEITAAGGLLGRKIKPMVVDCRSDWNKFASEAERLITEEKVCTLFGGWTSSSRKMMKQVVEKHDHLLVYPLQYEGLEASPNIVYLGSAPNQQILPAIEWARTQLGKSRFFLVGSDYVFPRAAYAIIQDNLKARGGEIVGEAFLPFGTVETTEAVDAILATRPDLIINCINGDTNVSFFRDLRAAGITPEEIPTLSFSINELELRTLDPESVVGDYAAWTYFQSVNNSENDQFKLRFLERYPQRVITDPMVSAYTGVKLWAQAVNDAQNINTKSIRKAMLGQRMQAPDGLIRIDSDTQHCVKTPRIGQIRMDGHFEIVWEAPEPIDPDPFPNSRTAEDWKAFLHDLYTGWGNHWSAPS